MSQIVEKMRQEIMDRSARFEEQTKGTKDEVMGLSEEDSVRFVQDKMTGDYEELSEDLKHLVKEKYDKVMAAKCANDIMAI